MRTIRANIVIAINDKGHWVACGTGSPEMSSKQTKLALEVAKRQARDLVDSSFAVRIEEVALELSPPVLIQDFFCIHTIDLEDPSYDTTAFVVAEDWREAAMNYTGHKKELLAESSQKVDSLGDLEELCYENGLYLKLVPMTFDQS